MAAGKEWGTGMSALKYFLFGGFVTKLYHDRGISAVVRSIKDDNEDYDLYVWTDKSNPLDLLIKYDGWDGFAEITREEYIQLKRINK